MTKPKAQQAQQAQKTDLTPRQAQIQVNNLLKGIDNDNVVIDRRQEEKRKKEARLRELMPVALTQPSPTSAPASQPQKSNGSVKAAGPKKAAAKPVPAKKAAKPAAKPAVKPSAKAAPAEKPPLKKALSDILAKAPGRQSTKSELYHAAVDKHGKWSRQSFYNAIKDAKIFHLDGENVSLLQRQIPASNQGEKDEADRYVEKVEAHQGTSAVV